MYFLTGLLPLLSVLVSVDALAVDHDLARRNYNAGSMTAPMARAASTAACPCACSQPGAMQMAATGGAASIANSTSLGAAASDSAAVGNATAGGAAAGGGAAKAIYFMTNQADNSVIMLPVQADGTLGQGSMIATGGKGGILIDQTTNKPAASDALASQGAIRVAGNNVFAVNAGSNSVSMFAIDPQNPAKLTAVGKPVESGGDVRCLLMLLLCTF
jgi:hypothetical protein